MKGIAHFMTGVAAASFFPWAVRAAEEGNPAYFILGGAFGLLPDTLDFKFYRYFYRHDLTIAPDAVHPDPQAIAEQLAGAMAKAFETEKGFRVKLSTIQTGADCWQQYRVHFDPSAQEVVVTFGPIVTTGQVPVPNTERKGLKPGRAKLPVPIKQTYEATTTVDIFDGPSFLFQKNSEAGITIHFLPWHRSWTHSFPVGIAWGLLCWLAWGIWALSTRESINGFVNGWRALVIVAVAYAGHLLEDQLGFMGSNLFFPFTKKRTQGLHLMRSGDAFPNFLTVWICCLLIFWNVYRFLDHPAYHFTFLQLALYGGIIPLGGFGILHKMLTRRKEKSEELDLSTEWGDPMMK